MPPTINTVTKLIFSEEPGKGIMERLTKTCQDGTHRAADNLPCGENSWDYKALLLERLGIYEDTGLEPEK